MKQHPETAAIDIPATDGTLLRLTLHREDDSGRFTYASLLEIQEHTASGLRPVMPYSAGSIVRAPNGAKGSLQIHDQVPGLTIERHWLINVADWIEMLTEASVDTWGVDAP
jgi:hypothetical protein